MLWIHIGMPKTGTTALQGYLHRNAPFLAENGIHYMATGRDRGTGKARLISHNSVAMNMIRGWRGAPENQSEAFAQEYAAQTDKQCVISSEMFFGRDLSPLTSHVLNNGDIPVKVIVYIRRLDDFLEAEYKQRVKNGRNAKGGVVGFAHQRIAALALNLDDMNFQTHFARIRAAIPQVEFVPRLYQRSELVGQDVITDFMSLLGVDPDTVTLPERSANKSLSRVATEALGMFDETTGLDAKARRQLGRILQTTGDPRLFASGDVLTDAERTKVNELFEDRNQALREEYFPDRERLFSAHTPYPEPRYARTRRSG
ncbi:MAG: hypothetical protein ACSHW1_04000 [Yoonia sp.]|uniref:hypothetical protein n=1 Tax=Yoonia sp. TaxID=2212373 RepID=UPI003EF222FF